MTSKHRNDPQFDDFFSAGHRTTAQKERRGSSAAPARAAVPQGNGQQRPPEYYREYDRAAQSIPAGWSDPARIPNGAPPIKRRSNTRTVLLAVIATIAALALIALAVFMLRPTDGGEYYRLYGTLPQVGNLRQTQAFKGSAWLDWDPMEAVSGYRIYRVDKLTGESIPVKTVYLSQATIGGLEQGTHTEYIVSPFCTTGQGEYEAPNGRSITLKTAPGATGALSHGDATDGSITLEWAASDGADGYIVERHTGSWLSYEVCSDSPDASTTVRGLEASTEYTFRMRPYVDLGGKRKYGSWSDKFTSATSPKAVYNLNQGQTTDSGYVLTWSVNSAATGFELYHADPATGLPTELISQCGTDHFEISGLSSVNYSSYCVRAFLRHSGGISYGEFSPVLTAVTLPTRVLAVDQYTSAGGDYTLSWQASERAEGYEIYAYSCHSKDYHLLTTVSDTSYTIADISEYAERYKVRAYVSLGDLQFFGLFSDELPCYPYYYLKRTVKVDVDSTDLRTYSGPEYELITTLSRGDKARVFGERSGSDGSRWFRVELPDGTTGWLSREHVSITNTCGTLTAREYTDEEPIIIYLSPSKQDGNYFWAKQTTEKEQMEAVGKVVHRILDEEYKCIVYTATPDLELRQRAFEALELKADVYLAIHSNATGTSDVHYGASSYYCGASGRSKKLGECINARLNAIAPMECTLNKQMYSALESFGGVGYAEVRDPYNLGMVALLAETDFHDNPVTGQWIIDNHEAIGRAYAEALAEAFDIPKINEQ